jgi:hypothetical protein
MRHLERLDVRFDFRVGAEFGPDRHFEFRGKAEDRKQAHPAVYLDVESNRQALANVLHRDMVCRGRAS